MSKEEETPDPGFFLGEIFSWDEPPPADILLEVETKVRKSIRENLGALKKPEDLLFHTVFLGSSMDGPSVFVFGAEGDPAFHCTYQDKTEWSSLKELSPPDENPS